MQSLWAGIGTFKRGHIWGLGDGSSITIWDDPWIPSSPNRRVMTTRENIVLTRFSELIDAETKQWDEELTRDPFDQLMQSILNTPLAIGAMEEFVSWHRTKNGFFLVRSSYHAEWDRQHGNKLRRLHPMGTFGTKIWRTYGLSKSQQKLEVIAGDPF